MKLGDIYRQGSPSIQRFMRDMKRAGIKMRYYRGRNFWHGPAVTVSSLQDALSNTKIPCQWDHMGLSYVVYPRAGLCT
jgi:hypothetical protein